MQVGIRTVDSRHTAYVETIDGKQYVVHDGRRGNPYDAVSNRSLTLSSDGKSIAYFAALGGQWFIVVNGIEGNRFPGPYSVAHPYFDNTMSLENDDIRPRFSDNGKLLWYLGREMWPYNKLYLWRVSDGQWTGSDQFETLLRGTVSFATGSESLSFSYTTGTMEQKITITLPPPPVPVLLSEGRQIPCRSSSAEMEKMIAKRKKGHTYFLRNAFETGKQSLYGFYDAELVRRDHLTGREEVLVESIKAALPHLQKTGSLTLRLWAEPEDGHPLFITVLSDSDAPPYQPYSFDPLTRQFSAIDIPMGSHDYLSVFSPNERHLLYLNADEKNNDNGVSQTLWLRDVVNNESRVLVQLSGDETFNANRSGGWGSYSDIGWVDDDTICYTVFRQSEKDGMYPEGRDNGMDAPPRRRMEVKVFF